MPPKSAVALRLQYMSVRKATFTSGIRVGNAKQLKYWPHDTPSPEEMAEYGFHYTPTRAQGDQVTCFWCGKKEKKLGGETAMSSLHYAHNDTCPYAVIFHFLTLYKNNANMEDYWSRLLHDEDTPVSVSQPHSEESVQLRLATFMNLWKFPAKSKAKVTARGMASSGFFFAPLHPDDDRVVCMYCACPVSEWNIGDDPLEEHVGISKEYRRANKLPACHFLVTLEQAREHNESLQRETSLLLDADAYASLSLFHVSGAISPEGSPIDKSENDILDTIMSPSQLPELLSEKAPINNDLEHLDISIEQLSDHESHLDKPLVAVRRYPRRKRTTTFSKRAFDDDFDQKSVSSLVLEYPSQSQHELPSNDLETDIFQSIDETHSSADVLAKSDPSALQDSFSVSDSSEEEDYPAPRGKVAPKRNVQTMKREKKIEPRKKAIKVPQSQSSFSDDEFGVSEKDIADILNFPRKNRKMKVLKTKEAVPLPIPQIHDLSGQNLGDYDETNLSFIEKDIRQEQLGRLKIERPEKVLTSLKAAETLSPPIVSPKEGLSNLFIPGSSVMETAKHEAIQELPISKIVAVDSPRKIAVEVKGISPVTDEAHDDISPVKANSNDQPSKLLSDADDIRESGPGPDDVPVDDGDQAEDFFIGEVDSDEDKEEEKSQHPDASEVSTGVTSVEKGAHKHAFERSEAQSHVENTRHPSVEAKEDSTVPTSNGDKSMEIKLPHNDEKLSTTAPSDSPANDKDSRKLNSEQEKPLVSGSIRKRSLDEEIPAVSSAKRQKTVAETTDEPAITTQAEIDLGDGKIPETQPLISISPSVSAMEPAEESPLREVVVSPSSYKEYMSDFHKMGEDSVNASAELVDVTHKSLISEKFQREESPPKQTVPSAAVAQESLNLGNVISAVASDHGQTKPRLHSEKELPSYVGDSVSEASPLLSMPPTPMKAATPNINAATERPSIGKSLQKDAGDGVKNGALRTEGDKQASEKVLSKVKGNSPINQEKSRQGPGSSKQPLGATSTAAGVSATDTNGVEKERFSLLVIHSSTPVKTQPPPSVLATAVKLPQLTMEGLLSEIEGIEDAVEYLQELAEKGYELHNDVDGGVTDFIAAMPEEEEDMTIEGWILHNAANCIRLVEDTRDRAIGDIETEFDRVIDYVVSLDTID